MTVMEKGPVLSDVLKREYDPFYNREHVTLTGGKFIVGRVIVKSGDKFAALSDPDNETAAGIVLFDADATSKDVPGVILARGPAVVAEDKLIWPDGITDAQKATALGQLEALGIVGRVSI